MTTLLPLTETSILIGVATGAVAACLLFRWLFDGMGELLGAFGFRTGSDSGWKLFHASRGQRWTSLARLSFGVVMPAILVGMAVSAQFSQLLS